VRIPYQWVIVGTLWVSHTVYFLNYMAVGTLAPLIRGEFRLTSAEIGLLCSAVTIGSAVSQIPAGMWSDSFGAKWVMVLGLLMICCATWAITLVHSYWIIFLLLVIVGAGIGANQTPGSKAIVMWFPLKGRATAMGIKQTGVAMGGMLASFSLPVIALHFQSWRYGFGVAGLAALASAGLVLALYRDAGSQSAEPIGPAARWEPNKLRTFLDRDFLLLCGAGILLMIVQFSFTAHFVLYATSVLHVPVDRAGVLLGISFLAGISGRIGWSYSSDYLFMARRKAVLTWIGMLGALVLAGFVPLGSSGSKASSRSHSASASLKCWNSISVSAWSKFQRLYSCSVCRNTSP
jgi:sugar phosphate permease